MTSLCAILPVLLDAGSFLAAQKQKLHDVFIEGSRWTLLVDGLKNTALITLGALCIGVVIGTLIAVIKYLAEDVPALKPLAKFCDV